ncbi:hypothetical protein BBJ28_00014039 [Nothophytophthora sp. Chile5]|nr:hypothetical protein BBJ28_00014039 [Nothophytophthora sp. Chile5]
MHYHSDHREGLSNGAKSSAGRRRPAASLHEDYFDCESWRRCCDVDARSDDSSQTMDEAVDLEVLAFMAASADACCSSSSSVSGLPLVCSNCGVSFFSLQITDDQVDCYCSGECKWSVIMYREMDLRMFQMRRRMAGSSTCSSSYDEDEEDDDDCELDGLEYAAASFARSDDAAVACH